LVCPATVSPRKADGEKVPLPLFEAKRVGMASRGPRGGRTNLGDSTVEAPLDKAELSAWIRQRQREGVSREEALNEHARREVEAATRRAVGKTSRRSPKRKQQPPPPGDAEQHDDYDDPDEELEEQLEDVLETMQYDLAALAVDVQSLLGWSSETEVEVSEFARVLIQAHPQSLAFNREICGKLFRCLSGGLDYMRIGDLSERVGPHAPAPLITTPSSSGERGGSHAESDTDILHQFKK
jgi:nucleotide-binding universal stress UspA family protein